MTPVPSPADGGRHLSPAQLREVVERYAQDVRAGRYVAEFDCDERWHVRIHQDDDVDVWLISWTTEQGTELHDHGDSSGAFAVVDGVLNEYVWSNTGRRGLLVNNVCHEGDITTFGPAYVHDVRNHREAPAVSVHAYSPPIRLMRYYDAVASELRHTGSSWTDDPEAPGPRSVAS